MLTTLTVVSKLESFTLATAKFQTDRYFFILFEAFARRDHLLRQPKATQSLRLKLANNFVFCLTLATQVA